MGKHLQSYLQPVKSRQRMGFALRLAAWGLLAGALVGWAIAAVRFGLGLELTFAAPLLAPLVGLALGGAVGLLWPHSWRAAARAVDERYRLKDRAATALEMVTRRDLSAVHRLAISDALDHLRTIDAGQVAPLRMPKVLPYALAVCSALVIAMWMVAWNAPAVAQSNEAIPVVVAQAERIEDELTELEEFAQKEKDPELEKLLRELKAAIEEVKQPSTDIRGALAKFSEMQAALQAEQAKQQAASTDAQLQAVGEALALAEPLAEAGQALAAGQYEKAAQQLENLEAPKLDRQTEKAVKEKLEQAARQSSDGQNSLSEAVSAMSQGLGGDGQKFSDGSKRLAGEARKQGKRKKLSDLLQKQCNCLGECKSECEECNSKSSGKSNKPGGKSWGLGESDGELGERTPQLGTNNKQNLTGKQTDEGESEVETTHSPEGSQEAQREYRKSYAKYREISESVLENEPIPLGQRQTIRKYFESIRPTDAEVDQVNEKLK